MRDPVPRAVELYFHCTLFAVHVTHCVPYMVFVYKVFSLNEVPLTCSRCPVRRRACVDRVVRE